MSKENPNWEDPDARIFEVRKGRLIDYKRAAKGTGVDVQEIGSPGDSYSNRFRTGTVSPENVLVSVGKGNPKLEPRLVKEVLERADLP